MSKCTVGMTVRRVNSDYKFIGTVRSVFAKNDGKERLVVEDDRGVLFIMNDSNVEEVPPALTAAPVVTGCDHCKAEIARLRAELAAEKERTRKATLAADVNSDLAKRTHDRLTAAEAELAAMKERVDANAQINNEVVGECLEILKSAPGECVTDACRRVTAQRDRLAGALRALVDAIDGVQDWNGTHVGDARTAALAELDKT